MDELLLSKAMREALVSVGLNQGEAGYELLLIRVLTSHQDWNAGEDEAGPVMATMLEDLDVRSYIGVNEFGGRSWFNRESFERLLYWLFTVSVIRSVKDHPGSMTASAREISRAYGLVTGLLRSSEASGYDLEEFLSALKGATEPAKPITSGRK